MVTVNPTTHSSEFRRLFTTPGQMLFYPLTLAAVVASMELPWSGADRFDMVGLPRLSALYAIRRHVCQHEVPSSNSFELAVHFGVYRILGTVAPGAGGTLSEHDPVSFRFRSYLHDTSASQQEDIVGLRRAQH